METINLSESNLLSLNSAFNKIIIDNPTSVEIINYVNQLKDFITHYQNTKEYMHPELRPELLNIIKTFSLIPKARAESIFQIASSSCNSCIFHNENCMINLIFIIFKSVEIDKFIDFNKLRPAMRMVF